MFIGEVHHLIWVLHLAPQNNHNSNITDHWPQVTITKNNNDKLWNIVIITKMYTETEVRRCGKMALMRFVTNLQFVKILYLWSPMKWSMIVQGMPVLNFLSTISTTIWSNFLSAASIFCKGCGFGTNESGGDHSY